MSGASLQFKIFIRNKGDIAKFSAVSNTEKIEPKNNKRTEQTCDRPLLSPSQDRDPEIARLYEIAVKGLRTRVGNPYIDTRAQRCAERHRHSRSTDNENNTTNMRRFVYRRGFGSYFLCSLSACRRILVVVVRVHMLICLIGVLSL